MWKPIPGWEFRYQVSHRGCVRELWHWKRGPSPKRVRVPRIIPQGTDKDGYATVMLNTKRKRSEPGAYKHCRVHRLVLEAFVGPCPMDHEAAHFPVNDPSNNRRSNLRWVTKVENETHRKIHGTDNSGERHPMAKLSWREVRKIRRLHSYALAQAERRGAGQVRGKYSTGYFAKKYGMTKATILKILTNQIWRQYDAR